LWTDPDTYCYRDGHGDAYRFTNCHGHSDCFAFGHRDRYADCDSYTNAVRFFDRHHPGWRVREWRNSEHDLE
jgi:hypothetical protein